MLYVTRSCSSGLSATFQTKRHQQLLAAAAIKHRNRKKTKIKLRTGLFLDTLCSSFAVSVHFFRLKRIVKKFVNHQRFLRTCGI